MTVAQKKTKSVENKDTFDKLFAVQEERTNLKKEIR
jgi:hypothetical protein